jgi:malonyl-CoA O-methyltransferase
MAADRRAPTSDPTLPEPRAVRRAFARAAATYDAAAVLQREVGARMIERLDVVKLAPSAILDAGCGTGDALGELAARYPRAARIALDVAMPMLTAARAKTGARQSAFARLAAGWRGAAIARAPAFVCADVVALPFAAASFELVWSNLTLQWLSDLPRALAEMHRVLAVDGLLTFTTFGPDTLKELRAAFAGVDAHPHVGRFVDMHDIGDLLVHTGFADPVMHMEAITMKYAEPMALLRDLKAIGATNAAAGRARGMMGRARFACMTGALASLARDGRIPATFEVVYGHAWKAERTRTAEGHAIVRIERKPGRLP